MRFVWFLILLLSVQFAWGQNSAKVRDLEKQRKAALAEIESTNQLLLETKKTATNSLNRLNLLSKQILARKQMISLLNQEVSEMDRQISTSRNQIEKLKKELGDKQSNYAKSAKSLYKRHNSQDKLLFILSADNFAQSLRRMRYLREYAEWQKRQANDIINKRKEIELHQQNLEKKRLAKNNLLGVRETEHSKLQSEEVNQKEEVKELSKKQKDLQAQLRKKRAQADALNRQIEQQIAIEIARAEAEAKAAREKAEREERERLAALKKSEKKGEKSPQPQPAPAKKEAAKEERVAETKGGYAMTRAERQLSGDFATNRGRLPYPVAGRHTVIAEFGEQQHQELKFVRTNNSGIDIQTSPGTEARAVFTGEVTRVFVVPGYNNSVIIRHGNYLTVYSNLSQVYVKAGDKVSTRQAIGKVFTDSEDANATVLHFQLWKEKTKLNPTPWLE